MLPASSVKTTNPDISASEGNSTGDGGSCTSSRADVKSQQGTRPSSSEVDPGEGSRNPFVDRMMTQTNLLVLPPSNPSYQMAHFLKTTGPVKDPSPKEAKPKRMSSAMRLFKNNSRRPSDSMTAAHKRFVKREDISKMLALIVSRPNQVIAEEEVIPEFQTQPADDISQTSKNSLLPPTQRLPDFVVPKVSKNGESESRAMPWLELINLAGKKYFEIEPANQKASIDPPAER